MGRDACFDSRYRADGMGQHSGWRDGDSNRELDLCNHDENKILSKGEGKK